MPDLEINPIRLDNCSLYGFSSTIHLLRKARKKFFEKNVQGQTVKRLMMQREQMAKV
jgi:hypothetical protein